MAQAKQSSNPLALAVLVLLFERPMHPYEMAATLKMRNKAGEHQVALRLALHRDRRPAAGWADLGPGNGPRWPSARADDL